ncbi:fumarylacetoacetate hydrolase family protein [Nocardia sp. SC052]|uniref:fumarylacetoacetate hydrolase family protein n=1 Tax=Nocardia sichangensis TaxID=3385975 RepID=UPI00399F1DEF
MKWVTYDSGHGDRVGVVVDGAIHGLAPGRTLIDLIAQGSEALRTIGIETAQNPYESVPLSEATLRSPIPQPPSLRDCLCFLDHLRNCQEAAGGTRALKDAWYQMPAFYFASPATVVGPYEDVQIAPGSIWFDFELEIGAVIGRPGRDLTPEEAESHIIGYTLYCDWTARDLQLREAPMAIGQAKGKDSATTLGPFLATPDELEPYFKHGKLALSVSATVNGELIGSGCTDQMDWSFAEVISYASRGVNLLPGDVFGSGTIPTCCLIEHLSLAEMEGFRGWLHDGDVVSLRADGLGETRQTIRASAKPHLLAPRKQPNQTPRRKRVNSAPALIPYTRGLHNLGSNVWAWLLPDGGYGWSNAGLVSGSGASLLVDTLYDLPLTREMLSTMEPLTVRDPITHAVLTHSNGDHTHGNQLLADSVRIVAASGTAEEMHHELPPEMSAATQFMDLGPVVNAYLRDRFGPFDFGGIRLRLPDETFEIELTLDIGGRQVRVLNLGPAHTAADSVVHIPDAGVLFGGDLLFIGCTPIVWSGPIANWVKACDAMIALDAPIVVPGHGPVTDPDGIRAVRDYFIHIVEQADGAHARGLSFVEAAQSIDLSEYTAWLDAERVVVNVYQRYRELEPKLPEVPRIQLIALMAEWDGKRGR